MSRQWERIGKRAVVALGDFLALTAATKEARTLLTREVLAGSWLDAEAVTFLANALARLEEIPREGGRAMVEAEGAFRIGLDLGYETSELRKDLLYLRQGEGALLAHLDRERPGFGDQVASIARALAGLGFNCFFTDRDGTVNNYCGRYDASVQSVYNAVFLSRFAKRRCETPIMLTSAPLGPPGYLDVDVMAGGTFVIGASKGREFLDARGYYGALPVPREDQELLDAFNASLAAFAATPEGRPFTMIGSGLQRKYGQTTIARQDVAGSIPEAASRALLDRVRTMAVELDPGGRRLFIEDTGLDVEIILGLETPSGRSKDFDKGDAVRFLARALSLDLSRGPHLVCGDTASDLPMLAAAVEAGAAVWAVFVTEKPELAARAEALCPGTLVAASPDVLVAALNALALAV